MKVTKERFEAIMAKVDELNEKHFDLAGDYHEIADGDGEPKYYDENGDIDEFGREALHEIDDKLMAIEKELQVYAKELGVPVEAFDTLLSSITQNRWEIYKALEG